MTAASRGCVHTVYTRGARRPGSEVPGNPGAGVRAEFTRERRGRPRRFKSESSPGLRPRAGHGSGPLCTRRRTDADSDPAQDQPGPVRFKSESPAQAGPAEPLAHRRGGAAFRWASPPSLRGLTLLRPSIVSDLTLWGFDQRSARTKERT